MEALLGKLASTAFGPTGGFIVLVLLIVVAFLTKQWLKCQQEIMTLLKDRVKTAEETAVKLHETTRILNEAMKAFRENIK